jgi:hypothetical protein
MRARSVTAHKGWSPTKMPTIRNILGTVGGTDFLGEAAHRKQHDQNAVES